MSTRTNLHVQGHEPQPAPARHQGLRPLACSRASRAIGKLACLQGVSPWPLALSSSSLAPAQLHSPSQQHAAVRVLRAAVHGGDASALQWLLCTTAVLGNSVMALADNLHRSFRNCIPTIARSCKVSPGPCVTASTWSAPVPPAALTSACQP